MSTLRWRTALPAALTAAAALVLAACGGGTGGGTTDGGTDAGATTASSPAESGGQPTVGTEPVTLRFSWWGNDVRGKATQAAIDQFESEYPNITIEPEFTDFGSYWDKLATEVASGEAPDVMQMQDSYLSTYVKNGTLLDLGTVSDIVDTSSFPDTALSTGIVDDKLYALVTSVAAEATLVNKTLFEQAGVDLPDDSSWTWDDYAALGKQLSEASGGAFVGIDSQVFEPVHLEGWAREHGETIFDAAGNVSISPETIASFWDYNLSLQDSGAALPASENIEQWNAGQSANPIMTGKAAMSVVGYNWLTKVQDASGGDIVLLRPPASPDSPEKRLFYRSGMYWSVSARSEHPAEAALFVNWLANSGESYDYLGTDRGLPVSTTVIDHLKPTMSPGDVAQIDYADAVADIVGDPYVVPPAGAGAINSLFQHYTELVILGQATSKDAAPQFIDELTQAIADAQ